MDITVLLPQDCLSHIISFTSPVDAIRSSVCCHASQSAADSDAVWDRFLPSDYREILPAELTSLPKKQLFLHLCDHPILINDGTMSFGLEKQSGKRCYMIGAKGLSIEWVADPSHYWTWRSLPPTESRFAEVAQLEFVWSLDVEGRIETRMLSPNTTYRVYFVYKVASRGGGFRNVFRTTPVQLRVSFKGSCEQDKDGEQTRRVILDPQDLQELPPVRGDGWKEVEMGEFFIEHGDDEVVVCRLWEFNSSFVKRGLIVQGIEFRPR